MRHIGPISAQNGELKVIHCDCGIDHLDPLPTAQEVDAYYRADRFYATHSPTDWFVENKREHGAGLWRTSYQYQADLLGEDYSPHVAGRAKRYPLVIDIGCGDGWFVEYYMYTLHSNAWGIEPSATARTMSVVDFRVTDSDAALVNTLGFMGVKRNTTDCVRMALVLEHVLDPIDTILLASRQFCGSRGKLLVIVPNEFNPLQNFVRRRYGSDWFVQKPHINYFTKASIQQLLRDSGFSITYAGGTFPMELFYLMGYKYIGNAKIGAQCHTMRLNFEKRYGRASYKLYHMLYRVLGWGRESMIVGQRCG